MYQEKKTTETTDIKLGKKSISEKNIYIYKNIANNNNNNNNKSLIRKHHHHLLQNQPKELF